MIIHRRGKHEPEFGVIYFDETTNVKRQWLCSSVCIMAYQQNSQEV